MSCRASLQRAAIKDTVSLNLAVVKECIRPYMSPSQLPWCPKITGRQTAFIYLGFPFFTSILLPASDFWTNTTLQGQVSIPYNVTPCRTSVDLDV